MSEGTITRRGFLGRALLLPVAAAVAGLATACREKLPPRRGPKPKPVNLGGACGDLSGVSSEEVDKRLKTFKYVVKSATPGKTCSHCALYSQPPMGGKCGTCKLFKGPVDPGGNCTSWAAMAKK